MGVDCVASANIANMRSYASRNRINWQIHKYIKVLKENYLKSNFPHLVDNFNIYPNTRLGKLVKAKKLEEILDLCDDFCPGEPPEYFFDRYASFSMRD